MEKETEAQRGERAPFRPHSHLVTTWLRVCISSLARTSLHRCQRIQILTADEEKGYSYFYIKKIIVGKGRERETLM